ncbi:MAG TPA: glycosyltransferase family 2 protein [Ignavibacteriaceae bacterium]|nr:glycosyltransferase family 2 protein [Ignavibacteriaceae bacterium]
MSNILKKNKVCAVIPFYNESKSINGIIRDTLPFVDRVIAVNDGSTDDSLLNVVKDDRVTLISYSSNKGKGFALNEGFRKSIEGNFDFTVTIDADFQHKPEYIPSLIKGLEDHDVIIGNRLNKLNRMPVQRILSNKITSFLLSIKTKQKILDSQCGFRAYRTKILNSILPSFAGFEAESEIILNAAKNNFRIAFVYVPTIYNNEKSKMRPFEAIKGFIRVMLK